MPVFYALVDNPLTPDQTDLRATMKPQKSVSEDELIEMIVLHNTGVTESTARKVLAEYTKALRYFLEKGRRVNTPLLNTNYSISGVFTSDEDSFDPGRHRLNLNLKPGLAIKDVVEQAELRKVEAGTSVPLLSTYFDTETGAKNDILTPNEMGRISGKRLKFDESDPAQGVFLINDKSKAYRVSKFAECRPSKIIFKVPANLPIGTYALEVRTEGDKVGKLAGALTVR